MKRLTLKLHDSSPQALSMKRLGQYLAKLSDMLGEVDHVHFSSVTEGSALLNMSIDAAHYPQVLTHVRDIPNGLGPQKNCIAYQELQRLMDEDATGGAILDDDQTPVLSFRKRPEANKPLVVSKTGSVQGRLYRVGGKDDTVPVHLTGANGQTLHCEASIDIAQQLSALLFKQISVSGHGVWERSEQGDWRLRKLKIESFHALDDSGASAVLAQLRSVGGLQWAKMDDPHGEAKRLRD